MTLFLTIATYCETLAPVSGPLLTSIGDTANALATAQRITASLNASSDELEHLLSAADQ